MKLTPVAVALSLTLAASAARADKPATRPAPPPAGAPSKPDAIAVLDAWVKAQNDGDFAAYGGLYDGAFVGIKRTDDGGQKQYSLSAWKTDRKKMFKAAQKVAAEGASVILKDGRATIDFTQRYQSGAYADHGDKELVLVAHDGKLTIAREEMLYSAPGWAADPKAEVDASALASPIVAKVRQVAADPSRVDDCGGVSYTLELTDAHKKKQRIDVGSGTIMIDRATVVYDADATADALFTFGAWCAGGADYYKIVRDGDALVVRYQGVDEGDGETPQPTPTWETRLTIKLAASAAIK